VNGQRRKKEKGGVPGPRGVQLPHTSVISDL